MSSESNTSQLSQLTLSSSNSIHSSLSSGHTGSTRQATQLDYEELGSPIVDHIWGVLVPVIPNKYETIQLVNTKYTFGRHPTNDVMFRKSIHHLNPTEFSNISKSHFVITKNGTTATITDLSLNGTLINNMRIPINRPIPLPHLSIISIGYPHNKCLQFYNRALQKMEFDLVPEMFFLSYTLEDVILGTGLTCTVRKGFKNTDFNKKVAVKIIDKNNKKLKPDRDFEYEVSIVKDLRHPNIVKIFDIFENLNFAYIVMDYANEGDLFAYIRTYGPIDEERAKVWFQTVLKTIQYLHDKNILHRDIKPENLLLHRENDGDLTLMLADFGSSRFLNDGSLCNSRIGTPGYWAPEVLSASREKGYSKEADVWSLGCLLYVFLIGRVPFEDHVVVPIAIQRLLANDALLQFPLAKNLMSSLLRFSPRERINIENALLHSWFTTDTEMRPSTSKRQKTTR